MEKSISSFARIVWKIIKWAFLILVLGLIILTIIRIPHVLKQQKTDAQVYKIHSTKLQMRDVMGENLPPDPGAGADKTVQGIDANNNGIRDDVELAIFKEYPNAAKTRAVLLQYAMALQRMTNQAFINEEIVTNVIQEKSRSYACVGNALVRDENNKKIMQKYFEDSDKLRSFVENKQLNTKERIENDESFYEKVESYSDIGSDCDIDLMKL